MIKKFINKQSILNVLLFAAYSLILVFVIEWFSRGSIEAAYSFFRHFFKIFLYNTLIGSVTLSPCFLFKRRLFAFSLGSFVWLVLGIANNFLIKFRETPLTFADLGMMKSAIELSDQYLSKNAMILIASLFIVVFLILGFIFFKSKKVKMKYLTNTLCLCIYLLTFSLLLNYGQPYADRLWSEQAGYEIVTSKVTDAYITNGSTTGSMMAISSNSKNKEKAIEFLNLLNSDEYLKNLVVYGVEGIHYEKIGDKTIKYTDKHADYDIAAFAFGNLFINYVLEGEPETKWDEFQAFNDESIASVALGFKFDTSNVTNELAAITNVLEEFKYALFSGSVDVDEYLNKMNTKLKEQGLDKVMEEMQTQIDEWKAEK